MMFDKLKKKMVKTGIVASVKKELKGKAKNIRIEDGSIKADPTDDFIEECGSREKADQEIEEIAKEAIQGYTGNLASTAKSKDKISDEESEEFENKIKKELK